MEIPLQLAPVLNAAGVPILALAMVVVIRAYKHLADAHKKQSDDLAVENERLRKQVAILDESTLQHLQRASQISLQSVDSIIELQNRKSLLLSTAEESNKRKVEAEVSKINEVIQLVNSLSDLGGKFRESAVFEQRRVDHDFRELIIALGNITDRLSDVPSKLASMKVVSTESEKQSLAAMLIGRQTALPYNEPTIPALASPTEASEGSHELADEFEVTDEAERTEPWKGQ